MADVEGVRLNHCLYSSEVNTLGDEGMRPQKWRKMEKNTMQVNKPENRFASPFEKKKGES